MASVARKLSKKRAQNAEVLKPVPEDDEWRHNFLIPNESRLTLPDDFFKEFRTTMYLGPVRTDVKYEKSVMWPRFKEALNIECHEVMNLFKSQQVAKAALIPALITIVYDR
jgi:hypothetical protein